MFSALYYKANVFSLTLFNALFTCGFSDLVAMGVVGFPLLHRMRPSIDEQLADGFISCGEK